jgi:hypothetical protein
VAGLLGHLFNCAPGACPVERDRGYDSDGFRIVELETFGLPLQSNVGHHVDE